MQVLFSNYRSRGGGGPGVDPGFSEGGGGGGGGGGLTTARGNGLCPLPRKAEKLLRLTDFVPFRRKSMSEIRMKAFRGILLILM